MRGITMRIGVGGFLVAVALAAGSDSRANKDDLKKLRDAQAYTYSVYHWEEEAALAAWEKAKAEYEKAKKEVEELGTLIANHPVGTAIAVTVALKDAKEGLEVAAKALAAAKAKYLAWVAAGAAAAVVGWNTGTELYQAGFYWSWKCWDPLCPDLRYARNSAPYTTVTDAARTGQAQALLLERLNASDPSRKHTIQDFANIQPILTYATEALKLNLILVLGAAAANSGDHLGFAAALSDLDAQLRRTPQTWRLTAQWLETTPSPAMPPSALPEIQEAHVKFQKIQRDVSAVVAPSEELRKVATAVQRVDDALMKLGVAWQAQFARSGTATPMWGDVFPKTTGGEFDAWRSRCRLGAAGCIPASERKLVIDTVSAVGAVRAPSWDPGKELAEMDALPNNTKGLLYPSNTTPVAVAQMLRVYADQLSPRGYAFGIVPAETDLAKMMASKPSPTTTPATTPTK